jgi:uncharacterized protein YgbK (DUF1537 family)
MEDLLDEGRWNRWREDVLQKLDRVTTALLLTAPANHDDRVGPELIPQRLAELAAMILKRGRTSGIVVSGGDAARALAEVLGARAIGLRSEIMPGMPFGVLIDGAADGLPIITKAGGFGTEDALIQAVDYLRYRDGK